jgi:hypothetical protein
MPSGRLENRIYTWTVRSLSIRVGNWNCLHALWQLLGNILKNMFPWSAFTLRQTELYSIWQSFKRV